MKTTEYHYQQLLHQATYLYNAEKELSGIFDALRVNISDVTVQHAITREANENHKHCARLEGLLEVLTKNAHRACGDEAAWNRFTQQFSSMLKRIASKHMDFGYGTAIDAASALGQDEIASLLKCCLTKGTTLTAKLQ